MLNIFQMSKKQSKIDPQFEGSIGLLIGFQFNDGRDDLLLPAVHSIHELRYHYENVTKINNSKGVKYFAINELFDRVSNPEDVDFDLNGFHLILISSMDEVNHILKDEDSGSFGCFLRLYEGNVDATAIDLVDFDRWNEVVEMMKNTTQEEYLNQQNKKNNHDKNN